MKIYFYLFLSLLLIFSCKQRLKGEGDIVQNEKLILQPVKNLELNGSYQAVLIQEDVNKVMVEGQDNIVDNLVMKVEGDDLIFEEKQPIHTNEIYKVYIYTTDIEKIHINDNVEFDVAGEIRKNKFQFYLSDNSNCLAQLFIEDLEITADDNSRISLKGNCSDLEAVLEDNVKFISPKFIATHADLEISGNVEANLQVIKELKGESSDNAILEYGGNPNKKFQTNDQSRIIKIK